MARKNARAAVVTDAPDLTADAVVEVVTSETVAPRGWSDIEAGTDQHDAPVAHVSADVAEAFGMTALVSTGLVVIEATEADVADHPAIASMMADYVGDAEPATVEAAEVVPEVADIVLRFVGVFTESAARDMAAFYAGKLGQPIDMVRGNVAIDTVFPARGGASAAAVPRAVRTEGNANLARAMAHLGGTAPKVERDWSQFDARAAWGANEAAYAQVAVRQWQNIADAAEVLDLDRLHAFSFAGSRDDGTGNTFTKNNGRYLRAMIAKVQQTIADRVATESFNADLARLIA